ncbi:MAG: GPMC system transcriptional regulator [Thermodesulfobacteriota bacterium]|nr:GPMC system transcriptional regulator [Thermodesulfobacteriota bacterium]
MHTPTQSKSAQYIDKINTYGKENIADILHVIAEAVNHLTQQNRCRIYLEDLTNGSLSCVSATGLHADELSNLNFPINTNAFLVSSVYASQEETTLKNLTTLRSDTAREFAERFQICASHIMPLLHNERAIGVLCVDSGHIGQIPSAEHRRELIHFLAQVIPTLDMARKYHQQLVLARRVDERKKLEAAFYMVKSAVRLIDNLSLASVLIPSPLSAQSNAEGLQILASYSEEREAKKLYKEEQLISLRKGDSLLSRYIDDNGIITDDRFLEPLYFPNLSEEALQKRYLTEQLGLKSLYMVPRYKAHTKRIICVVNYYTNKGYNFTEFERRLLEAHAEMAERVIQEIGDEHMEIQVLAEINDLLQERFDGLQPFLNRVLSKATELIGADTGSIALMRELEDGNWLVVEDAAGRVLGAKNKEWRKKNIPPIRIGGYELAPEQRSLTGYSAHCGQIQSTDNTDNIDAEDNFYRSLNGNIKSELAVPVISNEKVLAVICLDSFCPYYFTEEHKRILQIIERMIARYLADLQQIEALTGEVNHLRSDVGYKDPKVSSYKLGNIIGNSKKAREMVTFIQTITPPIFNRLASWSKKNSEEATLGLPSILITGDTGSGKEFLFNNIYSRLNEMYQSQIDSRCELPVKKSNIAAYSGELTYSELFGHKRGAFTGAHTDRKGILEEAHGGVVFLDEIGDADPKTQVQLLRFLDNGGFVRLGENKTRYARVLLIAATNKNLHKLINEGTFREDLYHRLSELTMEVPSLNERRDDIADLSIHFLGKLFRVYKQADELETDPPTLNSAALQVLKEHHYQGNMRELRSILLRALFFRQGKVIGGDDIRRVLSTAPNQQLTPPTAILTEQITGQIFESIVSGEETFWSALYTPYSSSQISRDIVAAVVNLARERGANNMPRIAAMLKACDARSTEDVERKTFYKFKNFLYKTIRIS